METDPTKRALDVEAGRWGGQDERVWLEMAEAEDVLLERKLTGEDVITFRDAVRIGLKWANDEEARLAAQVALLADEPTRTAMVQDGIAEGCRLAEQGYWLYDPPEV